MTKECIPVVPAQHYFMGGIWVDPVSYTHLATLELKNAEGAVFKRTIKAFLIMTAVYCVLAMVYAYILFPEFGL